MASTIAWDLVARDKASDKFKKVGDSADSVDGKFSKLGRGAAKLGKALAVGLAAGAAVAVAGIGKAINAASDLNEEISKSEVIFGKAQPIVEKFASSAARNLGQSKQTALAAASTFAIFGKSAGLAGGDLAKFSTDFVGLASDMASFNNTSPEEAIEAIGAALRGETEPIRRYGVMLDDATMRQQALKLGLIETTKQALTPQQKVLAAQALIYKQTGDAQGDFARTSDGLANQQRILKAEMENLTASAGQKFLPIAVKIGSVILRDVIPAVEKFASKAEPYVQKFFGAVQDDLWPIIQKVAAFFRDEVAPVVGTILTKALEGGRAAFESIREAIRRNEPEIRGMVTAFGKVVQFVGGVLGPTLKLVFQIIGGAISTTIDVVATLWRGWQKVDQIVIPIIRGLATTFMNVVGIIIDGAAKALGWVPGLGGKLKGAAEKFREFKEDVNAQLRGVNDVTVRARLIGGQETINKIADLRWEIAQIPRSVTVNVLNKVQRIPLNADGTRFFEGGLTWVGERGPELVSLPRGSEIFSNPESRTLARSNAAPTSSATESVATVQLVLDGRVIQQSLLRLKRANGRTDLELT